MRKRLALVLFAVMATPAGAGDAALKAEAIKQAIVGHRFASQWHGYDLDLTFKAGGTFDGSAAGGHVPMDGKWKLGEKDALCLEWGASAQSYGAQDACMTVREQGGTLTLYDTILGSKQMTLEPKSR